MSCNDPQLDNARLKPAVGFKMSAAANRKRRHWKRTVNILFFKMKTKCICCYCVLCSLQYIIYNLQGWGCCTDWLYWSANTGMSTIKSRTFVEDGKQESSQTAPLRHQATPPLQRGCSVWMLPQLSRWATQLPNAEPSLGQAQEPWCQCSTGVEADWIRNHLSSSHTEKSQMTSDFMEQIGRSGLVKEAAHVPDLGGCPLLLHFKG